MIRCLIACLVVSISLAAAAEPPDYTRCPNGLIRASTPSDPTGVDERGDAAVAVISELQGPVEILLGNHTQRYRDGQCVRVEQPLCRFTGPARVAVLPLAQGAAPVPLSRVPADAWLPVEPWPFRGPRGLLRVFPGVRGGVAVYLAAAASDGLACVRARRQTEPVPAGVNYWCSATTCTDMAVGGGAPDGKSTWYQRFAIGQGPAVRLKVLR